MNCFEWQNHSSDFLDGYLAPELKIEADHHLEKCKLCTDRHQHYRLILTSIVNQPRSALPIPIRKSPFSVGGPQVKASKLGRNHWERLPWYVRTSLEGTSIVLLILLGISAGPRLRAFYESKVERSLNEFSQTFNDQSKTSDSTISLHDPAAALTQLSRGRVTENSAGAGGAEDFSNSEEGDSESDSSSVEEDSSSTDGDIHVGNSEIWRFIVKSDSPHEFRPKIVQLLTSLKVPSNTPGLGGIEAPGGIQFDLLLPQAAIASLKRQLQSLAPPPPKALEDTPMGETFTWYKNKSKRKLPDGRTRVVIWLSQM